MNLFAILVTLSALLSNVVLKASAGGHYSIVSPGTIHPNSRFNVAVSVQQVTESSKVKLKIEGPNFEKSTEVEVKPMTVENVEFVIPEIVNGLWKLSAEGLSGLIFTNSTELNFADHKPSIYIQTDKAKYKPGDLVQFRVIFLDENMRPAKIDRPVTIFIKDAENNRIKQFHNVEHQLSTGVFKNDTQLSDFPLLGAWTIDVWFDGSSISKKYFDVSKYVLSKFQVLIDAPKKISIQDEALGLTVRTKYTFGTLVAGTTIVKIKSYRLGNPKNDQVNEYFPRTLYSRTAEGFVTVSTVVSIGKFYLDFKLKELFPDGIGSGIPNIVEITVESEEKLTGKKQTAFTTVDVVQNRFQLNSPNVNVDCTDPAAKFNFSVTVTNLNDEPVSDAKNAVTFQPKAKDSLDLPMERSFLNKSGVASVVLSCDLHKDSTIHVSYEGEHSEGTVTAKQSLTEVPIEPVTNFNVQVLTKTPKHGEEIKVQVRSPVPLNYFIYHVVARGNIVESELVKVSEVGSKSHNFKFRATFEMMPTAHIFVYYVEGNDLKFHETRFYLEKNYFNSLAITAPIQAAPGDTVPIRVRTDPNSMVGLLGVDQSVLLLKSGNDFDGEAILKDVEKFTTHTPSHYTRAITIYPGGTSGVITMTNAHFPHVIYPYVVNDYFGPVRAPVAPSYAEPSIPKSPQVRKNFLETWFFEDFTSFNMESAVLMKKIPDTITSWVVTGFSLNPETGFALTKHPTNIKTFRPFFITSNLPYAVKRGEHVDLPFIVFNYMNEELEVEVTMANEDDEFEFLDPTANGTTSVKKLFVSANSGETVNFKIRPKKVGHISLKVTAVSALAGDAINKKLKVEPEGITVFKNREFYLRAEEGDLIISDNITLDIPEDVVADSEHIEVTIMGDILGSTITNIDELVRLPTGCGEQNMINFVSNILVLQYLESIYQLNPAIEEKAKKHLEIGYQRELSYRHDNGSYSAFGKSDKSGSTWLTAYVMRSFHQASKYTDIDPEVLEQGLDFLSHIQAADGHFPEIGKVLDFSHFNDVGLKAFVLLAFLENTEYLAKHKNTVDRCFQYLEQNVGKTEDLYALSIAVYALQIHKSAVVPDLLKKLDVQAKIDGGHKWWAKAVEEVRTDQSWRPKSNDVEVTGYILLTLIDRNEPVLPITKWLISQRNSNGGFSSTQETVVGLQALIKFAEKTNGVGTDLMINLNAVDTSKNFHVIPDNALVLQSFVLQNQVRELSFMANGKGTAILQVSYRYNIKKKDVKPSFKLEIKQKNETRHEQLSLDICTEFLPLAKENEVSESNMVVVEVALPSGYVADKESFEALKQVEVVKRIETKEGDTLVVIYLDSLEVHNIKCLPLEAELEHVVECQKPASVVIYDYYDSQKRATEFYEVGSKCEDNKDDENKKGT